MATYKENHGTNIETVTSDPSNPVVGQMWYNSTSRTLKGFILSPASWASGGNINSDGHFQAAGAGIQTAGLIAGGGTQWPGVGVTANTETYNGSSWTEVNNLNPWTLDYVRFKWWKPEDHYDKWHSEHDFCQPYRTLSFLLYLSDNNCSTHFRRHQSVATRAGRGIMFPAYFTHEHRGEQCKDGLDRYMLSGYYSFYEVIK